MTDLLDLNRDELQALLTAWGQPGYRAGQVWRWLYANLAASPDRMTNLPKSLRARLADETHIGNLTPITHQQSQDGETIKWLFKSSPLLEEPVLSLPKETEGGQAAQIETVLMNYERRRTACISSQAGCGMGCTFCATGQMGLQRNLSVGEIVAQALFVARHLARQDEALTNVVLMGMGEPLANYDATMTALRRLTDPDGFNLGQRRISLSTVGLPPAMRRFSQEGLQVNLAVSLHAATDKLRDTLVPVNRRYPLDRLLAACRDYVAHTGRRISFEWALIKDVNDSPGQARALAKRVRGMRCHVNLIPLNPSARYPGAPSPPERVDAFRAELERHGIPTTVRVRRGIDIQAGCGQLRERELGK
ncbi:MAG: 23S rRNA (adenine(2503)-C(2))-methyltransferase RlmN [Anaerolineae bacterium]|jgi:23S rRNA (adenine2503-C2)-methyltransferase